MSPRRRATRAWIALCLGLHAGLWAGAALAQGSVRIPGEVVLEDGFLTLGRIAVLEGIPAAVARELESLPLGPAAAPAETRTLGAAALRARIHSLAPDVEVRAPEHIIVRRAHQEVEPEWVRARVHQALEAREPWPDAEVTFEQWRLPPRFSIPANASGLRIHFRGGEDFSGRVTAELEFFDPREPERPQARRSASVGVVVRRPVVVATRDLRRGTTPEPGALDTELRDLRRIPADALTDVSAASRERLKRNVSQGSVLSADFFDAPRIVRRGDSVEVAAGAGALDVRVSARALEAGQLGEVIRVENPTSRTSFAVRLTGPGTAVIAGRRQTR